MFSYLLDVIQGKRPQFWVWSPAIESLWIVGWAIAGGLLIWSVRSPLVLLGTSSILVVVLYGGCFWLLQHQGGWIPLLTPAIAFVITAGGLAVYTAIQTKPALMSS
jgi:adenylate cyclase